MSIAVAPDLNFYWNGWIENCFTQLTDHFDKYSVTAEHKFLLDKNSIVGRAKHWYDNISKIVVTTYEGFVTQIKTIFPENIYRVKLEAELYVKQISNESAGHTKVKIMQTLSIQQSDEEKIRVIVDRMLAELQDRFGIMEPKTITK